MTSHDHVSDPEAAGDFDYVLPDPDDDPWDQPQTPDDIRFDAFNMNTWSFRPAPTPWYRTRPAVTALIATAGAAAAIVVAGVLLVFRGPGDYVDEPTSVTTTAPATTPAATASSRPRPAAATTAATATTGPPPPLRAATAPLPPPPEAATAGGGVNDHRDGADSADRPTTADKEARDRGDSHAHHPIADQRAAAAASPHIIDRCNGLDRLVLISGYR